MLHGQGVSAGMGSLCGCCMCGWGHAGVLHGQGVSACVLHVWMGHVGIMHGQAGADLEGVLWVLKNPPHS